jgi:glucokinase
MLDKQLVFNYTSLNQQLISKNNMDERFRSTELIRQKNRREILKVVRKEQTLEQSTIIKRTGLSKQTVNTIIVDLVKNGLIIEVKLGNSSAKGGRKPMILKFNPKAYFLVGMLVGENRIRCGITDLNGKILLEKDIISRLDGDPEKTANKMVDLFNSTVEQKSIKNKKLLGLGVGLPGPVDFDKGIVRLFTRHTKWHEFPLKEVLKEKIDIPVILDNEANVRAIGEKWFGFGFDVNNFISIMFRDDGIGAGIVIGEELFRGRNYIAGQFGQMLTKGADDKLSNFEYFLGDKYIGSLIRKRSKNFDQKKSDYVKQINLKRKIRLKELFEKYNKKDEFATDVMKDVSVYFSLLISSLVCHFDIDLIIVQGSYSIIDDRFFSEVKEFVDKNVFSEIDKDFQIIRSINSREMGIMGSASMVLDVVKI